MSQCAKKSLGNTIATNFEHGDASLLGLTKLAGPDEMPCLGVRRHHGVSQQRQGISTGLASSVSSSRTATLTRSRKATQTRTVRDTTVCALQPSRSQST